MAGTSESLLQTQTLNSLYTALDPKSLLLSQFSNSDQPQFLQLTTDCFLMEKGPRYKAYADLREKKLRIKHMKQSIPEEEEEEEEEKDYNNELFDLTPPKKQVKFQGNFVTPPKRTKGSSILTQSVPDFSSAFRKENRKPPTMLPTLKEKSATPPPAGSKSGKFYGVVGNIGGSKSVNSGDKRNGGLMTRKSYANVEELKGLASVARSAINGDNRVGRNSSRIAGKTILGYRQL
ncbi:PREDICTED: uncharacterized protein LOC109239946 [Nicotiana attenuata]|uniref:Uncharacterized protein n=1 Tax=Nicotiana attenuata TaxID=49451 RepID=A0A314L8C6_NICAT|nr:PREDICTED: uncharacterized protein LOC109239946 [Nicotiana attenuata]OIT38041.1 hypothetical protein A4A49_17273 [Nicotiana attenuata]